MLLTRVLLRLRGFDKRSLIIMSPNPSSPSPRKKFEENNGVLNIPNPNPPSASTSSSSTTSSTIPPKEPEVKPSTSTTTATPPPPPPSTTTTGRKPFLTISVDGNISSGKSTLVSTLVNLLKNSKEESSFNIGVETVPEPLHKWTNLEGHNLLEMLYKDTTRYNFLFQHYVQLTRLTDTVKDVEEQGDIKGDEGSLGVVRVMERSIQNNRYCFSELARRQGTLHEAEFSVIAEWYKWLEEHTELPLDLIIYLRTTPDTVFNRMTVRGRSEESTVPLKYLSDLHETYEDWLIRGKIDEEDSKIPKKYEVMVIDADKGKEEVAEQCTTLIKEFLKRKIEEKEKEKLQASTKDKEEEGGVTVKVTPTKKPPPTPEEKENVDANGLSSPAKKLKLDDE